LYEEVVFTVTIKKGGGKAMDIDIRKLTVEELCNKVKEKTLFLVAEQLVLLLLHLELH